MSANFQFQTLPAGDILVLQGAGGKGGIADRTGADQKPRRPREHYTIPLNESIFLGPFASESYWRFEHYIHQRVAKEGVLL